MSEYEVGDGRYEPLKPEAVFDHGGVARMEIHQIKCGGKTKGGRPTEGRRQKMRENPPARSQSAKAQGKVSKWKKCQICGKTDHTADKCCQRFKHKDGRTSKVQDALASSGARKTT